MITLRVDNTVHDFDSWKQVFDRYDDFRRSHGVRSYRLARFAEDPQHLVLDLDFDDSTTAHAFRTALEKVWASPASRKQVTGQHKAAFLDVVVQRTLS